MEPKTIYLVMKDDEDHWCARDPIGWTDDKEEAEAYALTLSKLHHEATVNYWAKPPHTAKVLPFDEAKYRAYFVEEAPRLNSECLEEAQCSS